MPDQGHILPIVTIQHDFKDVIYDVRDGTVASESFWVSCYKQGKTSVNGKVVVRRASRTGAKSGDNASGSEEDGDVLAGGVAFESLGGISFEHSPRKVGYTISCPALSIPVTPIKTPRATYKLSSSSESNNPNYDAQPTAFDVAPDRSQFACGFGNGKVERRKIPLPSSSTNGHGPTASTTGSNSLDTPRVTKPHLSTITSIRYFPSSKVLLSASADFSLAVFDATSASSGSGSDSTSTAILAPTSPTSPRSPQARRDPSAPVRTLRAHTRSITDTAIIARGRNILSSAKDGTLRLWDVPSAKVATTFASPGYSAIMKIALAEQGSIFGSRPPGEQDPDAGGCQAESPPSETDDKIVFCALANGTFSVVDLGSKKTIFHSPPSQSGGLTAISYLPSKSLLATGSSGGQIRVYDVRKLPLQSSPEQTQNQGASEAACLSSFKRNDASIEDLVLLDGLPSCLATPSRDPQTARTSLIVVTADSLPYIVDPLAPSSSPGAGETEPQVLAELVGSDCDAVRVAKVDVTVAVWTAGDDGVVRMY